LTFPSADERRAFVQQWLDENEVGQDASVAALARNLTEIVAVSDRTLRRDVKSALESISTNGYH